MLSNLIFATLCSLYFRTFCGHCFYLLSHFYFRRFKKVYFTNVKFLKEVKDETSNRSKLRNFLVLLSRLLALAALIFAFAQPYLADKVIDQKQDNYVSLFVDNSYSMRALSEDVPLIDKAKSTARDIISAFAETDQFQIVTHNLSSKQQRWTNKEDALLLIDEIDITPEVNKLSSVLNRQTNLLNTVDGNNSIYILSDFQKIISDLPTDIDSNLNVQLMPFQSIQENNISIDSVWLNSPVAIKNQSNPLVVKISNYGNEDKRDIRLFVKENNQTKPVGTFNIDANSSVIDTIDMVFTQDGWQNIEVQIEDYPILFDDSYLLSLNINDNVKIMSLNEGGGNKYVTALMSGLANFNLTNQSMNNVQYNKFVDNDLIILNDLNTLSSGLATELENYILEGGKVLVFPGANANKETYNSFFSKMASNAMSDFSSEEREVFKINTKEFIFSNVYQRIDKNLKLPVSKGNYTFSNFTSRGGQTLLNYRDGSPYLQKYNKGKGILYVCASPLNENNSDLVRIAEVFVPMVYKMALSSGNTKAISYTIGNDNLVETNNVSLGVESIYKIKGKQEFIPGQTKVGNKTIIDFNDMISKSGYYDLSVNDTIVDRYAFNYDRTESKLDFLNSQNLKEKYGSTYEIYEDFLKADLSQMISDKDKGKSLWRLFLILALVFLALETLLLRFWNV